ncbi:MAG: zinc transporter ZupT [Candidatus Stahlbacteria bacterium]|nr:zinc transporter ZupT [Candidatus Stahlbacteria bacterium]
MSRNMGLALLLTAGAGLSTTIGSLFGFIQKKPGDKFMSFVLGFSAGVMIMVSFVELLHTSIEHIGFISANSAFLSGLIIMFLIDYFIPHEYIGQHDFYQSQSKSRVLHAGLFLALGIGIHNFPEGIATFVSTLQETKLGISVAIAIALHNIPEGLAVSSTIYFATQNRGKAFLWSFLSGITEPLGAVIAAIVLAPFLSPIILNYVLAITAGIMVFISLDELIPLSKSFGQEHLPIVGLIVGMAVMTISLWILR